MTPINDNDDYIPRFMKHIGSLNLVLFSPHSKNDEEKSLGILGLLDLMITLVDIPRFNRSDAFIEFSK